MKTKYIFITGGVVSGLGKGITAASLGRLLKARGYSVTNQKFDPYINIDPGIMNPLEHGEAFVTDDGAETDLDIGHYERFTDENLTIAASVTTGKIYWSVMNKERNGEYNGKTVQVIPHITNEIKEAVYRAGKDKDVVITEIGGTVGDIESLPFLEAIRQVAIESGRENVMYIHVTLLPFISKSGEMKSKPTQHSVKELLSIGIQPDMIVCRSEREMEPGMKEKIALFCNVAPKNVIQNLDTDCIYNILLQLENEGFGEIVCDRLSLENHVPDLSEWETIVAKQRAITKTVEIALVGKYVGLRDAYLSVVEALNHAGIFRGVRVNITWLDPKELVGKTYEEMRVIFAKVNGILLPGGFAKYDEDGTENAVMYARMSKTPCFGISLGMQLMFLDLLRFVGNAGEACFCDSGQGALIPYSFLCQRDVAADKRIGAYPCELKPGSIAYDAYGTKDISERHRHKYEINPDFLEQAAKSGLRATGTSPDGRLTEIIELDKIEHPFFLGVIYRPEFKSRPNRPHPLFMAFVSACMAVED